MTANDQSQVDIPGDVDPLVAFERLSDAFFALNEDWEFTYLNGRAAELARTDPEALIGESLWETVPEARDTEFEEAFRRAMREQTTVEFEAYYEPLERWFDVTAYPADDGLSVFARDITEQRDRITELRQTTEDLQRVLETSPIGIVVFNADREVIRMNERGEEILGRLSEAASDVVKDPTVAGGIVNGEGEPMEPEEYVSSRAMEREETIKGQIYGLGPETDRTWLSANAAPAFDEQGKVDRVVVTFEDVTERRERQQRLRRQNERLEEFASVVSHDLRNPLSVAEGYLDMVASEVDEAELRDRLDRVSEAHDRMDDLIEDLLDLASIEQSPTETRLVSLSEVARQAWEGVGTDAATLSVEDDAELRADPSHFRRLLENLLRNSVEHGGDGVTVRVGALSGGFFVADDGPGIPEADRGEVFERGYTTDSDGTGFGLSIVESIARAHGWSVVLSESDTGGIRFEFRGVAGGEQDGTEQSE